MITTRKLSKETEKYLAELRTQILNMDMIGIKRALDKIEKVIQVINGLKSEAKSKVEMGKYTEKDKFISTIPVDILYKATSNIETIIEIKYPNATIYGRKINVKERKQQDLMEWYVVLSETLIFIVGRLEDE